MNHEDLTLSDVLRLIKAIERSNTNPDVVRAVIESVPAEPIENGRVTVGTINRLLRQTNGCTVLPDEIVAMLNQPEPSPARLIMTQQGAHAIMGTNFFGVEEAVWHFGVKPTMVQLATLAEVPFTKETLEQCKDTHILVAVFPLSILDIREKNKTIFKNQSWYNNEAFAADKGKIGWHLVKKTPVPGSISKTWDQQQSLLGQDDEIPTAQVLAYTIIGHFLATGKQLSKNVYVRTSSVLSDGCHVVLGYFAASGLDVSCYFGDDPGGPLGVASARKL